MKTRVIAAGWMMAMALAMSAQAQEGYSPLPPLFSAPRAAEASGLERSVTFGGHGVLDR